MTWSERKPQRVAPASRAHGRPRRLGIGGLALGLGLASAWPATDLAAKPSAKLRLESPAFAAGKPIPKKYAYRGEGNNVSPPLKWQARRKGVRSFALVVDDPDAPNPKRPRKKPWVHWVLYNIPAARRSLAEGSTGGGTPGKNDFGKLGWGGPLPPRRSGRHRYVFHLYALDSELSLQPGATKHDLLSAMKGHVVATGKLYGTYARS